MPILTIIGNRPGGAGPVHFRHDTNNHTGEPLSLSFDNGATWETYDPNNRPANEAQWRLALYVAAVDSWNSLLASQQNCNTSGTFDIFLAQYLLIPDPPCPHCNSPNGVCEAWKYYPVYVTRMLTFLHFGSGPHGALWTFPNQAWVVRREVYRAQHDTHAPPGSPLEAPAHWTLYQGVRVGPTCLHDGIRCLCDYNIVWTQFGTYPRPT